ncbi:hypothetical protein HDU76_000289 [Blyttiomyces sp. JEL0837]|nr:hypothetical protein HDU76_000289 [Blyttiomyces sp. JEL0837]
MSIQRHPFQIQTQLGGSEVSNSGFVTAGSVSSLSALYSTSWWSSVDYSNFPDYETCAAREDVQSAATIWSQLIQLATALPAFIIAPLIGYAVDRLGRRTVMILPVVSSIMNYTGILFVARYGIGLWSLVGIHLIQGLLGGSAVLMTCVYAYLADTTTSTGRTEQFLFTDAFTFTAFTLGPFLGGLLYKELGLLWVFYLILIMEGLALAYIIFILPESMRKKKDGPTNSHGSPTSPDSSLWQIFTSSWYNILTVLGAPGRGNSVRILSIVTTVSQMVFAGYQLVFFFYPAKRFGWDSYDNGLFSLTNSVCRLFYLTIFLPRLLKRFASGEKSPVQRIQFELMVIRTGMFLYVLGFTSFGLATHGWMFFVIAIFDGFGVVALPTVRALLSRTVPNSQQGRLFAALEMLQSGANLISQAVLPAIYSSTVSTFPQAICFVIAGVWACALSMTVWLKSRELVSLSEEEDRFGDYESGGGVGSAGVNGNGNGAGEIDGILATVDEEFEAEVAEVLEETAHENQM